MCDNFRNFFPINLIVGWKCEAFPSNSQHLWSGFWTNMGTLSSLTNWLLFDVETDHKQRKDRENPSNVEISNSELQIRAIFGTHPMLSSPGNGSWTEWFLNDEGTRSLGLFCSSLPEMGQNCEIFRYWKFRISIISTIMQEQCLDLATKSSCISKVTASWELKIAVTTAKDRCYGSL